MGGSRQRIRMGVEVVTQDRMPQLQHMDAQLVRATCDGSQLDQAVAVLHFQFLPQGQGVTPLLVIHLLLRAVGPVDAERQVNLTRLCLRLTPHPGEVVLLGLPLAKLPTQLPMRVGIEGNDNDACGGHVEAMSCRRLGVLLFDPMQDAVFILGAAPGDA